MKKIWRPIKHYLVFFLLMAFIITCSMTLFVSTMSESLGIELTSENLGIAAKLTFANVLLLSLLCTVIDSLRRKWMVERPVKRILQAAERIAAGDFSVRIAPMRSFYAEEKWDEVIACFNKMAGELSSIETLRTDFVANVSHELKTPLSVIENYGTLLQQRDLSEEKRAEYARTVAQSARRLADLVSNILKLNKLENQQIFPTFTQYDLGEQLCECLLQFENAWEEKGLEIEVDMEENILVRSDPEMMALVWHNLFSNAVKFTPKGGRITLSLRGEGNDAVVSVSDTGCGISRDTGARIFDKFYQGDTSHAAQGNGLGLALVRRVVDVTGSDISVSSEVGKGTTFTVKMRRAADANMEKPRT